MPGNWQPKEVTSRYDPHCLLQCRELFQRAKALNGTTFSEGRPILKAYKEVNELFLEPTCIPPRDRHDRQVWPGYWIYHNAMTRFPSTQNNETTSAGLQPKSLALPGGGHQHDHLDIVPRPASSGFLLIRLNPCLATQLQSVSLLTSAQFVDGVC